MGSTATEYRRYAEKEKEEEDKEEEEETPPHDRDEYLFSLWLYYNVLLDRSNALAQQSSQMQSVAGKRLTDDSKYSSSSSQQYQEREEEDEDFSGSGGRHGRHRSVHTKATRSSNTDASSSHGQVTWQTGISCNVRHFCCHICRCTRLNLVAYKQQQWLEHERLSSTELQTARQSDTDCASISASVPASLIVGHSHQTHRCVADFDHYCVFLGTDIAQQNYRLFLACTVFLVLLVFPIFISATTEHVGRMSLMKHEYLQSLRVINAHMDPLHVNTLSGADIDGGNSTGSHRPTNSRSGSDMLQDYRKPLFLRAFLVWTLMMWIQMFFLMCFHMYCRFWKGVKARNMLQILRYSVARFIRRVTGHTKVAAEPETIHARSSDSHGSGRMGYDV